MAHHSLERARLAELWHTSAQLRRSDVFGQADPLRPIYRAPCSLVAQVDIPAVGTVGPRYAPGGVVLVSVNPAGGKETSKATPIDDRLYDAFASLHAARAPDIEAAFETLVRVFAESVPTWKITQQYVTKILSALGLQFDAVSYLYVVPFRTRDDAGSKIPPVFIHAGYEKHLRAQLDLLQPRLIVALDKPTYDCSQIWAAQQVTAAEAFYFTRKRDAHMERRALLQQLELRRPYESG